MRARDTIFAVSTAPGKAAIAVVRVSGPLARDAVEALSPPLPQPRSAAFRRISGPGGDVIDSGLVLWFAGPKSETGEDIAEFHVHGSRAVTAALLEALGQMPGLRPAEAGEFTRRAFENGKLDLTAVEGLADLVEAETGAQRRQALRQLSGALGRLYDGWRERILAILALAEAGIDFVDEEDVPEGVWATARPQAEALAAEIAAHMADGHRGERIREGATLVIAGPPNAGKSSLMNALARRDVAIVSEIPGTTRDAIEVRLDLGGAAVTVIDTAGLREAGDVIEAEGVRRAQARIAEADLVLWVYDATGPEQSSPAGIGEAEVWPVANKSDLLEPDSPRPDRAEIAISVLHGDGLDDLITRLEEHFRSEVELAGSPMITRQRHRRQLAEAQSALEAAVAGDYAGQPDLVAEHLRRAAAALGRITGRIDVEDVLDVIFRDFCIGK